MNVDQERGKTQACHPERSEGSPVATQASPGDHDPSLRSG